MVATVFALTTAARWSVAMVGGARDYQKVSRTRSRPTVQRWESPSQPPGFEGHGLQKVPPIGPFTRSDVQLTESDGFGSRIAGISPKMSGVSGRLCREGPESVLGWRHTS